MKLSNQYSDPDLLRQVTTVAAILGSIAINTLSNFFPLNGVNVGTLSNTLFSSVQIIPANYAFAIWGLIVNVAIALYSLNWNGWGIAPTVWTVIMLMISAAIAASVTIQRQDTAYLLVIIWAFVAIAIRQMETPLIAVTGWVMAIALILLSLGIKFTSFPKTQ